MNNSIVKLHNRKDNSVILVDLDTVILIDSLDEDGKYFSMIYCDPFRRDMENTFEVNETPEKIFTTYPELGKYFLKLHDRETNRITCVEINYIQVIDTEYDNAGKLCSKVYVTEDSITPYIVNETPEKIYTMIEEIYKTIPNGE
ncbi:MAG: hypothetical protein IKO36_09630 [Bacteroidaceae bacterium]|nr:hypothetical protein [Bacteroidaceae bacterium]